MDSNRDAGRAAPDGDESDEALLKRGIERVPADIFLCDGYRYTNLTDALAQAARRDKKAKPSTP